MHVARRTAIASTAILRTALCLLALTAAATAQDQDGDGYPDVEDNCQATPNNQCDRDQDGYGNACDVDFDQSLDITSADAGFINAALQTGLDSGRGEDLDCDGDVDGTDYNPLFLAQFTSSGAPGPSGLGCAGTSPCLVDTDGDGFENSADNCTAVANDQCDIDQDGYGNACDADFDNDFDVDGLDFNPGFLLAFTGSGLDDGRGQDLDCDGDVDGLDFNPAFLNQFTGAGVPGPSGLLCAGNAGCVAESLPGVRIVPSASDQRYGLERGGTVVGTLAQDPEATGRILLIPPDGSLTADGAGNFRFDSAAGGTGPATRLRYAPIGPSGVPGAAAEVVFELFDPVEGSYAANELSSRALVVYNLNAPDSQTIADHYADARGIAPGSLQRCGVRLPPGLYATADELVGARDQILEDCICPLIPVGDRPPDCGPDDPAAIGAVSPISHLVLIRGVPGRLFDTGWTQDFEEPALAPVLGYLLYHEASEVFDCGAACAIGEIGRTLDDAVPFLRDPTSPGVERLRSLEPSLDAFAVAGTVEALTAARTLDLIDRTLLAEGQGFQGNIVVETAEDFARLRDRTASFGSGCTDYVTNADQWLDADPTCRTGSNEATGLLPGGGGDIPEALNVGLLIGSAALLNSQAGFNNFATLTNWRKTAGCTPLCADTSDPAACRAASEDVFSELDTACVGGAPGLIGHQSRSFPVAYYGFYPSGWRAGDTGTQEKTPPRVLDDGGAAGDRYLHLGTYGAATPDGSQCEMPGGGLGPCPEHVFALLETDAALPGVPATPRTYEVSFSYRSQTAGSLGVQIVVRDASGTQAVSATAQVPITASLPGTGWLSAGPISLSLDPTALTQVDFARLGLSATRSHGLAGFFDLDDVQWVDVTAGGAPLLSAERGSFEGAGGTALPQDQTHLGDYASNAIDRLGGVAWWGSSSHFLYNGFAFTRSASTSRALFGGHSLAESVYLAGNVESGHLYGDPLYRPSAAALFFANRASDKRMPLAVDPVAGQRVTAGNLDAYRYLFMNVLHGTDPARLAGVSWELATCTSPASTPLDAEDCPAWTVRETGTGSQQERRIDWTQTLLDDPMDPQFVVVRLRVWNTGEDARALFDFSYLDYRPDLP